VGTAITTQNLFEIARQARASRNAKVWIRPDGRVALAPMEGPSLGRLTMDVQEVHVHPRRDDDALELMARLREDFPNAKFHGFSPGWLARHGMDRLSQLGLDSLCWFTGELGQDGPASQGWQELGEHEIPKIGVFLYGPEHSWQQVEDRVGQMSQARNLLQVVPLPRAVGDLVVIPGATTDGTQDIELLARCRRMLPSGVRVRASWAALGWKMAQSSLAFGCDALAGWGMEEQLAYSGRMRPADLVGEDEVLAGLREAGMESL